MPQKFQAEMNPPPERPKEEKRQKIFGAAAERISREEYDTVVDEILARAEGHFRRLEAPEQLADKPDFGDIDLVSLADAPYNEDFFRRAFGEDMLEYSHTKRSSLYQILLRLESGKQVQVDFMQAEDEADLESKRMYYSKGHLSPMVGILAQNLNFKYGTEGFFKRYKDSKGQWHDILITKELTEGLQILGYDLTAFDAVKTNDDIPAFVASSPYFDSGYYEPRKLVRRHREAMRRIQRQEDLRAELATMEGKRQVADEDRYLRDLFPDKLAGYRREVDEIEGQITQRSEERAQRLQKRLRTYEAK